jgi:hypothetical protein
MSSLVHLAKRFTGSLSKRPPNESDETWAQSQMTPHEIELWRRMSNADRRHAVTVARRFEQFRGQSVRDEVAGALLHDVGKVDSGLGTLGRVVATIVGPRTRRFRTYHDHEAIGARWLEEAGSSTVTVDLIRRRGPAGPALDRADDL